MRLDQKKKIIKNHLHKKIKLNLKKSPTCFLQEIYLEHKNKENLKEMVRKKRNHAIPPKESWNSYINIRLGRP